VCVPGSGAVAKKVQYLEPVFPLLGEDNEDNCEDHGQLEEDACGKKYQKKARLLFRTGERNKEVEPLGRRLTEP
jgi:hypothetical protein